MQFDTQIGRLKCGSANERVADRKRELVMDGVRDRASDRGDRVSGTI